MVGKFFSLDENFRNIIKKTLPGKMIENINFISTGWTNIVYEVETDDGSYFFRFPRDEFWERTIVKDCQFADYINGRTSFETAQLKMHIDGDRAFSVHRKVEGRPLAEKLKDMSDEDVQQVSREIAEFMCELHGLKYNKNDVFKVDNIGLNLVDFLDELLEKHVDPKDKIFWKYEDFIKKDEKTLVHGDLNSSNIILDENNHIASVIDFGFAGFGNKYYDIARIVGREPDKLKKYVVREYEKISGEKLDMKVLDEEIDLWNKIDGGYINYMRGIGIYE